MDMILQKKGYLFLLLLEFKVFEGFAPQRFHIFLYFLTMN